ncbi:hypothetical protein SEUCBS140593_003174 [Sporothrix eucalyptigena]|uniref:Uncharacterized protein n=1 Tax=Sporothrix eucalyptigena TaxID=1812306 RepID=A0ABP0BCX0_9PEZI
MLLLSNLLDASYFTGFARSTFSLAAAIRRTSLPEAGPVIINTKRDVVDDLARREEQPTFEVYRGSLNRIIGGVRDQRVDSIWP